MIERKIWVASDDETFNEASDCEAHESLLRKTEAIDAFLLARYNYSKKKAVEYRKILFEWVEWDGKPAEPNADLEGKP